MDQSRSRFSRPLYTYIWMLPPVALLHALFMAAVVRVSTD